jgi:hypothetical protein
MPGSVSKSLRIANANLRTGLARLLPEANASSLNPKDLSRLLTELLHAGNCFRSVSPDCAADLEWQEAISEYRSIVEQMAKLLPRVQGRLLTEKARLEIARAHLTATAAWAQASRTTI